MKKVRKWVRRIHLTLALGLGLFISALGLSGSVLVFGDEVDGWLRPELRRVAVDSDAEPADLDRILASVREAMPEGRPIYLHLPADERTAHLLWLMNDDGEFIKAYADPYTAEVLGLTHEHAGFVGFMHDLHIHLLIGDDGVTVVGVLGLGLLALLGTGLYLWWPGLRQLRAALVVKWSASLRRRIYDLHRATGAWGAALLGFVTVTGVSLAFYPWVAPALVATLGGELPTDTVALEEPASGTAAWQQVLDAAQAEFPEAQPRWYYFPAEPGQSAAVQLRHPENWNPHGNSFVYVHPENGRVLGTYDWRSVAPGKTLVDLLYPLHVGHFGPTLLVRCIMVLVGLMPTLLMGTGVWLWWQRRRTAAARRAGASAGGVRPVVQGGI